MSHCQLQLFLICSVLTQYSVARIWKTDTESLVGEDKTTLDLLTARGFLATNTSIKQIDILAVSEIEEPKNPLRLVIFVISESYFYIGTDKKSNLVTFHDNLEDYNKAKTQAELQVDSNGLEGVNWKAAKELPTSSIFPSMIQLDQDGSPVAAADSVNTGSTVPVTPNENVELTTKKRTMTGRFRNNTVKLMNSETLNRYWENDTGMFVGLYCTVAKQKCRYHVFMSNVSPTAGMSLPKSNLTVSGDYTDSVEQAEKAYFLYYTYPLDAKWKKIDDIEPATQDIAVSLQQLAIDNAPWIPVEKSITFKVYVDPLCNNIYMIGEYPDVASRSRRMFFVAGQKEPVMLHHVSYSMLPTHILKAYQIYTKWTYCFDEDMFTNGLGVYVKKKDVVLRNVSTDTETLSDIHKEITKQFSERHKLESLLPENNKWFECVALMPIVINAESDSETPFSYCFFGTLKNSKNFIVIVNLHNYYNSKQLSTEFISTGFNYEVDIKFFRHLTVTYTGNVAWQGKPREEDMTSMIATAMTKLKTEKDASIEHLKLVNIAHYVLQCQEEPQVLLLCARIIEHKTTVSPLGLSGLFAAIATKTTTEEEKTIEVDNNNNNGEDEQVTEKVIVTTIDAKMITEVIDNGIKKNLDDLTIVRRSAEAILQF